MNDMPMNLRPRPIIVATLAIASHLYVWWGHWAEASTAVRIASGGALAGAILGVAVPGRFVRAHIAIAAALMLNVASFAATRVIDRWPFAWDALPDRRYAGFIAAMGLAVAVGLVRGAFWARWAAIAFAAGSMLGGALNAIWMRHVRDESLWLAGAIGVCGALTVLSQLAGPGVRERFSRHAPHALWTSRDRLIRTTRWAAIASFAAAPMLVLYALAQPVAPPTVVSALVLAPILAIGGVLVIARRSAGILILALGGVALAAHTIVTAACVVDGDLLIAGYYATFWLPAALLGVAAGVLAVHRLSSAAR
jgi:hypothetical protein